MNITVHDWAAVSISVMLGCMLWMDWVPTALNRNIRYMSMRERLPGSLIHLLVGCAFMVANILVLKWALLAGALWFSLVLFAAIRNWWIAYFCGAYLGEITPEIYASQYTSNLRVLPHFKHNPIVPDLQHMLIHTAVFVVVVLSWVSFWRA